MKSCLPAFLAAAALATATGRDLPTDTTPMPEPPEIQDSKSGDRPPLLDAKADFSHTFGGETTFRGEKSADSDAFNLNFSAATLLPLGGRWMMPLELKAQWISLDDPAGVPMPDSIETLELGLGIAWQPADRWMFMASLNPTLYKLDDIEGDDLGFSGGLMAEWEYNRSWKWMFGLMVQPDNDLPVIPLVGFEWKIDDCWTLEFPFSPRLTYAPDERWSFHLGIDMILGTTFRTSDTLGSSLGLPEFDGELGSYSEFRLGAGVGWKLTDSLKLEAEAGYSFDRKIEYSDIDEEVEFDDAPYIRLGLRFEF